MNGFQPVCPRLQFSFLVTTLHARFPSRGNEFCPFPDRHSAFLTLRQRSCCSCRSRPPAPRWPVLQGTPSLGRAPGQRRPRRPEHALPCRTAPFLSSFPPDAFYPPSFLPTFKESVGPVLSMLLRYPWSASVRSRFGDARIRRRRLRHPREDRVAEAEAPCYLVASGPEARDEWRHRRGRPSERLWLGPMRFLSPSWSRRVWVHRRVSELCGSAPRVRPFSGSAVAQPWDKSCRTLLLVPALEKPKFLRSVHRSPLRLVWLFPFSSFSLPLSCSVIYLSNFYLLTYLFTVEYIYCSS